MGEDSAMFTHRALLCVLRRSDLADFLRSKFSAFYLNKLPSAIADLEEKITSEVVFEFHTYTKQQK
jgi:hypothetical protein